MGLEIRGEIVLRNGQVSMEMDINKAMSPMSQFGINLTRTLLDSVVVDFYQKKLRLYLKIFFFDFF